MPRIAVIGLGAAGKIHAANLIAHGEAELSAVCDPRPEAAKAISEESGARTTSSAAELLDTQPDAVIISSSTATHGEIVGECVAAGVPFLCEKPLAQDSLSAAGIVASVEESGLVAATALNRRFHPQYAAMRDAVLAGGIGQCELLCFTSRSTAPPTVEFSRTSGGLFAEKGSHFFDLARWISGAEPEELTAMGAVLVDPGFEEIGEHDTALISMRMRSGVLCRFDFSWRTSYGQDERIEIHGSRGLLASHQDAVGTVVQADGQSVRPGNRLATWQERFAESYKRELDAFLSVLASGRHHSALATLNDGLMAQRICEAARSSAADRAPSRFNGANDNWNRPAQVPCEPSGAMLERTGKC